MAAASPWNIQACSKEPSVDEFIHFPNRESDVCFEQSGLSFMESSEYHRLESARLLQCDLNQYTLSDQNWINNLKWRTTQQEDFSNNLYHMQEMHSSTPFMNAAQSSDTFISPLHELFSSSVGYQDPFLSAFHSSGLNSMLVSSTNASIIEDKFSNFPLKNSSPATSEVVVVRNQDSENLHKKAKASSSSESVNNSAVTDSTKKRPQEDNSNGAVSSKRVQMESASWVEDSNGVFATYYTTNSKGNRIPALNTNLKPRARQGSANDPQSIAARHRRERISDRLKILQELVPNSTKVDLVTMLEKAINYVKFLQLQVKVLTSDAYWPQRPKAENNTNNQWQGAVQAQ